MSVLNQRFFVLAAECVNLLHYLLLMCSSPLLIVFLRIPLSPNSLIVFVLVCHVHGGLSGIAWQKHVGGGIDKLAATFFVVLRHIPRICHHFIHHAIISDGPFLYQPLLLLLLLYQEVLLGLITPIINQCLIDIHGG